MLHRYAQPRTRCFMRNGGFTLIELLAVIVLIAILAAVTVPTFSNANSSRQSGAARALYSDMLYARQHAMASGRATWVVFDESAETWSLHATSTDGEERLELLDPMTGNPMTITLNEGDWINVSLTSVVFDGATEVGFDWLGRPLNSAGELLAETGTVVLNQVVNVHVHPESGLVGITIP